MRPEGNTSLQSSLPYFNPRTPYGVRPANRKHADHICDISIHALHTECDHSTYKNNKFLDAISIHALHTECDSAMIAFAVALGVFQSTHSIRSATVDYGCNICNPELFQSTHSIRSATVARNAMILEDNFNPRTPYGVRHSCTRIVKRRLGISIHALHTECDSGNKRNKVIPHSNYHVFPVIVTLILSSYDKRQGKFKAFHCQKVTEISRSTKCEVRIPQENHVSLAFAPSPTLL